MDDFTRSLAKRVQQILNERDYRPMKQHELARVLKLKGTKRQDLRQVLRTLEHSGAVIRLRKNRWAPPEAANQVTGRLSVHVRGFGFVTPDDKDADEVYIPSRKLLTALHGDRVLVSVFRADRGRRGGVAGIDRRSGQEGSVVRILERANSTLVGLLKKTPHYSYVIPDNPRMLVDVRIRSAKGAPRPNENHMVVVRLDKWSNPDLPLTGVIEEDLGETDEPGVDMLALLRSRQLQTEFPVETEREAQGHSTTLTPEELRGRRDLRSLLTFTIDPENAKDFDDAVSIEPAADGTLRLGIHIADVACRVPLGSAIDAEALQRATSVYLVDRVIPMLPAHLTSDVCSLLPNQDRLAHSVVLTLDKEARVVEREMFAAVIRSRARLTYDQVQTHFDGAGSRGIPKEVQGVLADMRQLAARLRAARMAHGSIALELPEIRCELDAKGSVKGIHRRQSAEAYHLIEEFMLLANREVALRLFEAEGPALYRIHEEPDEEQWAKMGLELEMLDIRPGPSDRDGINAISNSITGKPVAYAAQLAILRNFKRAVYSPKRAEHFGLAFTHYTHFTSPIRRYPDLIVHRVLRALIERAPPPYRAKEMNALAEHCSERERAADDAERESVEIKRVQYYAGKLWSGDIGPYEGVVVKVVPKGLLVELQETLQRGLVPFRLLTDDHYRASPDRTHALGRHRRKVWKVGDPVRVELDRVDTARRLVDLRVAGQPKTKKQGRQRMR